MVDIASEAPHGTVHRSPDKEPRGGSAVRFVDADQVSLRVVREQRLDVETHQVTMASHTRCLGCTSTGGALSSGRAGLARGGKKLAQGIHEVRASQNAALAAVGRAFDDDQL